jgi:hypothetical protein
MEGRDAEATILAVKPSVKQLNYPFTGTKSRVLLPMYIRIIVARHLPKFAETDAYYCIE